MHPLPGECPVCHGEMVVIGMQCRECDTTINGRFHTGPFSTLSAEQMTFVELFVRNEGKITRMEDDLGVSYPTIRNRLHEIIRAMGFEPGKDEGGPITEEDRRKILEDLNEGKITSEEAMQMLKE